jgi:hypothetical protein
MRSLLLSSLLGLMATVPGTSAQLALWVFTGADPIPVTSTDANLSAGDLSRNGVTPTSTDTLFYTGTDWSVGGYGAGYFELSLTPHAGFQIDYSTVTFDYVVGSNPAFTTMLVSSVDGFSSALSTHTDPPGSQTYSDSLAALGVQSGSVTFRVYGFVDSNFGSSGLFGGSVSFNSPAEAVVATGAPEPSSLALIFGGGLALAIARRRLSGLSEALLE